MTNISLSLKKRRINSKKMRYFFKIKSLLIIFSVVLFLANCATTSVKEEAESENELISLQDKWGIKIEGIRLSAAGYMLDFRYRVIDPEKAAPLFDRQTKPYLIDQESGAKFIVPSPPKVGPLRTSNPPQADRTYFILFANPGKYVKQGNKVTVVIGEFKAENLTVN